MDHRNTFLILAVLLAFVGGTTKLMRADIIVAQSKPTTGINLYVAKDDWNLAQKTAESRPEDDDFVAHIQTPEVPSKAFTVRWLVDDKVIEEDTLQPNSQSWLVGAKWGKPTTGSHVVKIVIDVNNDIAETDETDNYYAIKMKR